MDEAERTIELPDEGGQTAQGRRGDGDDYKHDMIGSGSDGRARRETEDISISWRKTWYNKIRVDYGRNSTGER